GARHFLRRLDAEGASELRYRFIPLRSNQPLQPLAYADIDRFRLDAIEVYPTLVLRRSPVASRPPSEYRLVERRHWYEVWQRRPAARLARCLAVPARTGRGGAGRVGAIGVAPADPGGLALWAAARLDRSRGLRRRSGCRLQDRRVPRASV